MSSLKYLAGYPTDVLDQVGRLLDSGRLTSILLQKYPLAHDIKSDKALYMHVMDLKNRFLRQSAPIGKIVYDDKIDIEHRALGLHTTVSRVQGGRLKSKNEIRIGSVFKSAPQPVLDTVVIHELAHLREKQHNKAFYQLCEHMLPGYRQMEFDMRLYLTHLDVLGPLYQPGFSA